MGYVILKCWIFVKNIIYKSSKIHLVFKFSFIIFILHKLKNKGNMNLDSIKSKLQSLQPKPKTTYEKIDYTKIYFKPQPGKYQIRIVPSKFDKNNPFREIYFHYGFAKFPILALTNWNEQDPIVEIVQQLRKTKDPENWNLAKKLNPKMRVFAPVVVRGKESEGVRLWEFGVEVYKELMKWTEDEDFGGDFTDVANGRDFTIEVEKANVGGRDVNKVTSIRIKPKTSQLSDDTALVEKLLEEQPDILSINKKFKYDDLKDIVQKWLTPEEDSNEPVISTTGDEDESEDLPAESSKPSVTNKFDALFKS